MKKTKCLFDGRSHKGLVSVSQFYFGQELVTPVDAEVIIHD